ncbi:MAG TPA: hypothetical protein VMV18_12775 [bacterium]|nr:hypothetical protein [bacterium]
MDLTNDPLADAKIASPCDMKWEDMTGDARVRFCDKCALHVYNFASMTRPEVTALIERTEGRLCARLYRRTDGTVITSDCPVAYDRLKFRVGVMVASFFSFATVALGAVLAVGRGRSDLDLTKLTPVTKVCNWATGNSNAYQPVAGGMPVMGKVAYIPPSTPVPIATPFVQLRPPKKHP